MDPYGRYRSRSRRHRLTVPAQFPHIFPQTGPIAVNSDAPGYIRMTDRRGREYTASDTSSMSSSSRSSSDSASYSSGTGDDSIIHFDWDKGMKLGDRGRYEVVRKLGDGTFGRVLECYDFKLEAPIAVKVIRDIDRYVKNAKVESKILKKVHEIRRLRRTCDGGRGIVRYYGDFFHAGKLFCLKFERLGRSLYEVIKKNNYRGFYMRDLQVVAREFLETLDFLHEECHLIHTDIKMENIMFCGRDVIETSPPPRIGGDSVYYRPVLLSDASRGEHRSIRIIDFGNGVFEKDHHSRMINTRQYRSPEVILEQGWDVKSDMWSAGCVIAEMFTGELLFPTHENMEHLAMIERVTGCRFDRNFFSYSPPQIKKRFADPRDEILNWPDGCQDSNSFRRVHECQPIERMFPDEPELGSLLSKLLRIDPRRRYSAAQGLDSDFFKLKLSKNE